MAGRGASLTATRIVRREVCLASPKNITYKHLEAFQPRTRGCRFKVECYLQGILYGTGSGPSKKAAKQAASQSAINQLCREDSEIRQTVIRIQNGGGDKRWTGARSLSQGRTRFLSRTTPSTSHSNPSSTSPNLRSVEPRFETERAFLLDHLRSQEERMGQLLSLEKELAARVNHLLNLEDTVHVELYNNYLQSTRPTVHSQRPYWDERFDVRASPQSYRSPSLFQPEHDDTYSFMQRHKYGGSSVSGSPKWTRPDTRSFQEYPDDHIYTSPRFNY